MRHTLTGMAVDGLARQLTEATGLYTVYGSHTILVGSTSVLCFPRRSFVFHAPIRSNYSKAVFIGGDDFVFPYYSNL